MPEEMLLNCRYRVLRYVPNIIRDEWVNIGVLLEQFEEEGDIHLRAAMRLIEDGSEIARVRRIHPGVDEELLRSFSGDFAKRLQLPSAEFAAYLAKLDQMLSNTLQFGPNKAVLTDDFDTELDRLYRDQVSPPARKRGGFVRRAVDTLRDRIADIFRRRRVLQSLEKNVPVAEFTYPGDSMTLDYGYRNGVRGFVQAVTLSRDVSKAKALAFTAERIRRRIKDVEFTAMTESEPDRNNPGHEFIQSLFAEQEIAIVPLSRAEIFAENLRVRLQ
jgi:hypothetical protein